MNSAIKTGVVPEFRGDHFFLSNFDVHVPFPWRNFTCYSGEQAFSLAKTMYAKNQTRGEEVAEKILATHVPGEAKKFGRDRKMELDVDLWDGGHRVQVMREIIHAKFMHVPGYGGKLINTGAMMLVEGNDWDDTFWGRCLDKATGKMVGLNTLGVILMEERGRWLQKG